MTDEAPGEVLLKVGDWVLITPSDDEGPVRAGTFRLRIAEASEGRIILTPDEPMSLRSVEIRVLTNMQAAIARYREKIGIDPPPPDQPTLRRIK